MCYSSIVVWCVICVCCLAWFHWVLFGLRFDFGMLVGLVVLLGFRVYFDLLGL